MIKYNVLGSLQLMPNCLPKGQEKYLVDLTLEERLFSLALTVTDVYHNCQKI